MEKYLLIALLLLVGCAPTPQTPYTKLDLGLYRYHDEAAKVTCWMVGANGISCLPDSETSLDYSK